MSVTPERRILSGLAEMKHAWGTELSARLDEPTSLSAAAGTLASMQRPLNPASGQGSSTTQRNQSLALSAMEGVTKKSPQDSSGESTDSTLEESASADEDGKATPAPLQSHLGGAPPPPLRNIPHQTPDTSPTTTSLLFSQQNLNQLTVPMQRQSVPKLGTTVPVLPSPAEKNRWSLPTSNYPVMVVRSPKPPSTLSTQQQWSETSNADMATLPSCRIVSEPGISRVIVSAPVSTSTPKPDAPRVAISAPVSTSSKAKRVLFPDGNGKRAVKHQTAVHSEPELRRIDVGGEMKKESNDNGVFSGQADTGEAGPSTAGEDIATVHSDSKRRPLRAPSKLLQRDMSQELSSSQSSDIDTVSIDSDLSETRDRFDSDARLPIRSLPTLARGGIAPLSGRFLLSPLSAGAIPFSRNPISLPPIVREVRPPLPPLQQTSSLPSYHEAGMNHERNSASSTPPNYYSSNFVMVPNLGREGGGGGGTRGGRRMQSQDMSNHPIHLAAMEGVSNSQMKSLALQNGVDYRDCGGRTPLMYAVLGNQPKMCELLLKLKADINAKDLAGLTPLLWATYQAKADIIRVLLKNGANARTTDQDGRTVFHWAMKTPNIHCLKWLCKHANIPEIVNQPDNEMLTALHWAVMSDQAAHIKMFLALTKADISVQDSEGRSPLNYAVLNFSPSCIKAILDYNEGAVSLIDSKGRTALHYACAEGSVDSVRTLLSYRKCDIHFTDNNGTTPLHWAAVANQPGLIQLLLRRGADRGQQDSSGYTSLQYAEQRGHTDCARILGSYGLRRPGSATSLASHVSVNINPQPSNLDEDGHVIFRQIQRQFSLSGSATVMSRDRLPADGQAQSENPAEVAGEHSHAREQQESGGPSGRREQVEGAEPTPGTEHSERGHLEGRKDTEEQGRRDLEPEQDSRQQGGSRDLELRPASGNIRTAGRSQSDQDVQIVISRIDAETEQLTHSERRRWRDLLCCGCCVHRTNVVTPM